MNKRKDRKRSKWLLPVGYARFFSRASDAAFRAKHPIGYPLLVLLGLAAFILPAALFVTLSMPEDSAWMILGIIGGMVSGIGLFNFVAIIIDQYLGHLVSLISFLAGGLMMLASWMLCH